LRPVTGEEELLLLCASCARTRAAAAARAAALAEAVDWDELLRLLARHRMVPLAGARLRELLPDGPPDDVAAAAARVLEGARGRALHNELATLRVATALERAGIATLPLKGALMAHRLYGDAALRESADVDLLVAAANLGRAAGELRELGYAAPPHAVRSPLHLRLVHPGDLPDVELHWRVHWYEERFSAEMLDGSRPDGPTRRARRDHELAALLLFWARDGFAGLRLAADVAQWWDHYGDELPGGALAALADRHPALRRALVAAARNAERLVGVPAAGQLGAAAPAWRGRPPAGVRVGDWRLAGDDDQVRANAALSDVLLAAPGARLQAARRRLVRDGAGPLHAARVTARWAIALWAVRGGREWAPPP
jgi:hypothetical protein